MSVAQSSTNSSGGIGFVGLLTILFVALKLTHVIGWSWWWVGGRRAVRWTRGRRATQSCPSPILRAG